MELSLETYVKRGATEAAEEIGRAKLVVQPGGYQHLESLESQLRETGAEEILVDFDARHIALEMPQPLAEIKEPKLRVTLEKEAALGHFHVVAKHAEDDSLIYTNTATIRTLVM